MKAIVTGMIGNFPLGGVAWDYAQYAIGLERLGFEVYYLEDSGLAPYDPERKDFSDDCSFAVGFLESTLRAMSPALGRRWRFVNLDGRSFGIEDQAFAQVLRESSLFLNVSGAAVMRDEYLTARNRVMIDTDPGLNHFHAFPQADRGHVFAGTHGWRAHEHFFTYALRMGRSDCPLPDFGVTWHPTVPPVVVDLWTSPASAGPLWTTVMSWNGIRVQVRHEGRGYGGKEPEFEKIEAVPGRTRAGFEVAVGGNSVPRDRLRSLGWRIRDSHEVSSAAGVYRDYILASRGEFSVAKNIYVDTRCGWFSCRSTCYLAAGRPTVVQDTGWTDFIAPGEGLLAFRDGDEAVAAIDAVEHDYARHAQAARAVAKKYFDHAVVLGDILEKAGVPLPR